MGNQDKEIHTNSDAEIRLIEYFDESNVIKNLGSSVEESSDGEIDRTESGFLSRSSSTRSFRYSLNNRASIIVAFAERVFLQR